MSGREVQIRWQDLDGLGHVSHVAALAFLEEGRDAWLALRGIARDQYVVGRCTVTYVAEIMPSDEVVTVHCELRRAGRSSLATAERVVARDGRVMVQAEFELVLWDRGRRAPRPITDAERELLSTAEEVPACPPQ